MQLARLRIPRPNVSFEWIGALVGRSTILYMGYTSVLFLLCLLVTFPHDLLIRRLLTTVNQGPVTVAFTSAGFASQGYELSGLRVAPRNAEREPFLEIAHVFVRPALTEWVRGNPYAFVVTADLYGGNAQGQISFKDGGLAGTVEWHDISLGRYRTLTALLDEGQLAGRLSGQFGFEARGPNFSVGQGGGEISIDGLSTLAAKANGVTLPDSKLTQTKMKFKVGGGRIDIQELNASGDVGIQGAGQILLRDPAGESTLNLHATFVPSPATPDALKILLALIPRQPGSKPDAPVSITGPLSHPKIR